MVPYYADDFLVGWLARIVDGIIPHRSPDCKYVMPKGFTKSRYLYNLDRAQNYQTILVCEGVTDVWRVGPNAVAVIGSSPSAAQCALLDLYCGLGGRSLVFLLDGDVDYGKLDLPGYRRRFADRFVAVRLPDGKDPADFSTAELLAITRAQAAEQGVDPGKLDLPGHS